MIRNAPLAFVILCFFWVGTWGWFVYRKPEFFARIGLGGVTPQRLKYVRYIGLFYMALAAAALVLKIAMSVAQRGR
jgi:hypothetical protein